MAKRWKGDQFSPKTTVEEIQEVQRLNKEYADENAILLETYCSIKGIRDIPTMEGMRAFTKITKATREAWDQIFKTF